MCIFMDGLDIISIILFYVEFRGELDVRRIGRDRSGNRGLREGTGESKREQGGKRAYGHPTESLRKSMPCHDRDQDMDEGRRRRPA